MCSAPLVNTQDTVSEIVNPSGKEDQEEEGLAAIVFNCRILDTTDLGYDRNF